MTLRSERTLVRAPSRSTRHLLIDIAAPDASRDSTRRQTNVGIVLDRSGSMDGQLKFALASLAVEHALNMLQPHDRFTVVVYDNEAHVVMPSTLATHDARRTTLQRLREIGPRGSTDLYAGWMTGAAQMSQCLSTECVNTILLLTDGLANEGITQPSALTAAAGGLRARGIATTTFGVGEDFDECLLRDIAREGGGQSYFIESPAQIADFLTSAVGESLAVVRRNAVVEVALPVGARGALLNSYRATYREADHTLCIDVGDITAGAQIALVVRVTFPTDREDTLVHANATFTSAHSALPEAHWHVQWMYADHAANNAQPRDAMVDREVAAVYAARARASATEANRHGDLSRAKQLLRATAGRIRTYAGSDVVLTALWQELMAEAERFAEREFTPLERKRAFYVAEAGMRNRDWEGKTRR